jgi:hypothetical protein
MKRNSLNIALAIFLFAFSFPLNADNVNWITPVSDEDFLGRWEGRFSMDIPQLPGVNIPRTGVDVVFNIEYTKTPAAGGIFLINWAFDMERFLDALLSTPEMKALGLSKNALWDLMIADINVDSGEFAKYDITVKRYTVSMTETETTEEFMEDTSGGEVLISEDRTQIKLVFNERITLGFGDEGFSEVILHRR